MLDPPAPYVERPQIAFRVGVTGATALPQDGIDRLSQHVESVLKTVSDGIRDCATSAEAKRVYNQNSNPILRVISPLADGADRLVAAKALKLGFELEVPLPFVKEAYQATFTRATPEQHAASVAEFEGLLAHAGSRVLTLDGDSLSDIDRPLSYEAVGRLVVRNCDLLIAIWDDEKASKGRGGTSDIVLYALHAGVPVWWIHAASLVEPKWLSSILDLPRFGLPAQTAVPPEDALRSYVVKAILPPNAEERTPRAWVERGIDGLRDILGVESDPLIAFLGETGTPNRVYWNAHPIFVGALRKGGARRHARLLQANQSAAPPPLAPRSPQQIERPARRWPGQWGRFFSGPLRRNQMGRSSSAAARISTIYQERYRTSYTLVFLCGAIALVSAVLGAVFGRASKEPEFFATCGELLMLTIILTLVLANQVYRWHERYISYRMLGEFLRMSVHLHELGWSLPASRINNLARSAQHDWVSWFFAANVRAMPLPNGSFGAAALAKISHDISEVLIAGQLRFHDKRRIECRGAAHILGYFGRLLFLATLLFAIVRLGLEVYSSNYAESIIFVLSLLCAVLPAASAAFFGLRAYEEFEVLAEQSEQMHDALVRLQAGIKRVALDRTLASQLLGAEMYAVATIMLSDVTGWIQLFRMKAVDA